MTFFEEFTDLIGQRFACPAHGGDDPNAAAFPKDDGTVGVQCHSHGCDFRDIQAALIEQGADPAWFETGKNVAPGDRDAYHYIDFDGPDGPNIVVTKYRQKFEGSPSPFRSEPTGIRANTVPLYNVGQLRDAIRDGQTVYLVEGERDVETLRLHGVVATSHIDGSNVKNWTDLHLREFSGAHVVFLADNDRHGKGQQFAERLAPMIRPYAASLDVRISSDDRYKDVTDLYAAGLSVEDTVPLDGDDGMGLISLEHLNDEPLELTPWLWEGYVPLAAMTLMPGTPGIGKSTVCAEIAARVSRGQLSGDLRGYPRRTVILAAEDTMSTTTARLKAAGADLSRISVQQADADLSSFNIERDLSKLGRAVERCGDVSMVWVDALRTTMGKRENNDYGDVYAIMNLLARFAERYGVAVIAPWHMSKAGTIIGSVAFEAAARSILSVVRDEETQTALIGVEKMNGAADTAPALRYRLEGIEMPAVKRDVVTGARVTTVSSIARVAWLGEVEGHPREVIAAARAAAKDYNAAPVVWLRKYLTEHGPTPRDIVIGAGKDDEDFSEGQLKRAYKRLNGVKHAGRGFGGKAVWQLPAQEGHSSPWDPSDSQIEQKAAKSQEPSNNLNVNPQVSSNLANLAICHGPGDGSPIATPLDSDAKKAPGTWVRPDFTFTFENGGAS